MPAWLPPFGSMTVPPSVAVIPTVAPMAPVISSKVPSPLTNIFMPQKLHKILELEYVEMADLFPESWRLHKEEQSRCCHQVRRTVVWKGTVTDILLWIECYSSLVAVLRTKYPTAIAELMAKTIIKASKSFVGEDWVTYDTCYRRKAAAIKSLKWSEVDFNLFNETFADLLRCKYCSSEHSSNECMYAPELPPPGRTTSPSVKGKTTACLLFSSKSGNKCHYRFCKFEHKCLRCNRAHPWSACYRSRPELTKAHYTAR